MKNLKIVIAILLCCGCGFYPAFTLAKPQVSNKEPNQPAVKLIEPAKLKEDLDFLFKKIEEVHPNMYAYTSKEEFDLLRNKLYSQVTQPKTRINFLKLIAPTLASLKNPHTVVYDFSEYMNYIQNSGKIFPLSLSWYGGKVILTKNYTSKKLPLGGTILEINGEVVPKMIERLERYYSAEGRDTYPEAIERDKILRYLFWLEYGPAESLNVQIKVIDGTINDYEVEMTTFGEIKAKEEPNKGRNSYRHLPTYDAFLIKLDDWADWGRIAELTEFCNEVFTEIREQKTSHLIIDLRNNPGGDWANSEVFVTYLVNKPHHLFNGANPLRFDGAVYLLIGANSTSASTNFTAVIKDSRTVTIIGQEPGEPLTYYGNTTSFVLPNTHLQAAVPRTLIVLPGSKNDGRGIIPDHEVKQKPKDTAKGVDTVLQFTLDLIKKSDSKISATQEKENVVQN